MARHEEASPVAAPVEWQTALAEREVVVQVALHVVATPKPAEIRSAAQPLVMAV